jgi:glycosyltransferase involved in cell wall biosynthesis
MKINVIVEFPRIKDGIPRVTEELLKQLSTKNQVESIFVLTRRDLCFVSPSLLANKKIQLFATSKHVSLRTFAKIIKLYKEGDFLLFLAPPWRIFDPSQGLWLFLLIKYGFLPRAKWIQVLYDFIPYIFSEDTGEGKKAILLFNAFKKHFKDIPVRYVAISESTKRDAIRYWGLPANRINVVHPGSFVTPKSPRTNFGSKRVLMVSDIAPRKNHIRLLKAFEQVHRNGPSHDAELIIVGRSRVKVPEFESTLSDIRRRNEGICITLAGYLSDVEILALYDFADVFVYPSLYEGFGLPVLEAMACGCPVIASNVSSLPEVVGEAGILVDPYNVGELARAMLTVLNDDDLKKELSRRSIAQAQKFSWAGAADSYVSLFREVLAEQNKKGDS